VAFRAVVGTDGDLEVAVTPIPWPGAATLP
jgi:hypothetical protein